jgi:hypothetical protein
MTLTRVPLGMIDAGDDVEAGNTIVHDGQQLTALDVPDQNTDKYIGSGSFDKQAGMLSLQLVNKDGTNSGVLNIDGFLTASNLGVGKVGPTGNIGSKGAPGINGQDGRNGEQGCFGPKGDRGQQGATGAQGPGGNFGGIGDEGPTGPIGPTGATGPRGESFAFLASEAATIERALSGRKTQWGHIDSGVTQDVLRIFFPQAFETPPNYIAVTWIDPETSNVANNVKLEVIEKGYFDLKVITSQMGGAASSGWDLMYIAMGV